MLRQNRLLKFSEQPLVRQRAFGTNQTYKAASMDPAVNIGRIFSFTQ